MLVFFISSNVVNVLLIKCLYAGLFFIVFQMARNASHKPGVYICTNIDKSLGERLGKGQSSRQKLKSPCASVSVHVFGMPPCSSCACVYMNESEDQPSTWRSVCGGGAGARWDEGQRPFGEMTAWTLTDLWTPTPDPEDRPHPARTHETGRPARHLHCHLQSSQRGNRDPYI